MTTAWRIKDGSYPHLEGMQTASAGLTNPMPDYCWQIIDGDYPTLSIEYQAEDLSLSAPYPLWSWKITAEQDYPVLQHPQNPAPVPVYQTEYISVYDMKTPQTGFNSNGLRILLPTACKVTEELGGTYEVTLEHPIDPDGNWQQLMELNIVKAMGQLFLLYRVDTSFSGAVGKVTAYGRHISYQLNDAWVHYAKINAKTGQDAIDQIFAAMDAKPSPEGIDYRFVGFSDIDLPYTAELSECTPIAALIGTDSTSLVNQLGGELYRDNFYLSICKRMEGAKDNAFQLRVGLNLTGIDRSVDYTDFCTYLTSYDNFGNKYGVSYEPMVRFAHNVVRTVTFKYDNPDYEALKRDTHRYFEGVMFPHVTYKVRVADLKRNPDYKQFGNLNRYKVGDTGWIYDERLGMATKQQVIRTVKDAITGETLEITFGNLESSLTRPANLQNVITTPSERFQIRQQIAAEAKSVKTWDDLESYTWEVAKKFTWNQLRNRKG